MGTPEMRSQRVSVLATLESILVQNLLLTESSARTYADDCLVDRVQKHRIYLVATNVSVD
jgi:rRNA-processing protein FCF1